MHPQFTSPKKRSSKARGAASTILLALTFSVWVQNVTADQGHDIAISVKSKNTPLVDVLNTVSKASGYSFILGDEWKTTPISVNFDQLPLEDALHRILTSLNHAIIFDSANTIRINIFGVSAPAKSTTRIPARETMPRPDMGGIRGNDPNAGREPEQETPDNTPEVEQETTDEQAPVPPETGGPQADQEPAEGNRPK